MPTEAHIQSSHHDTLNRQRYSIYLLKSTYEPLPFTLKGQVTVQFISFLGLRYHRITMPPTKREASAELGITIDDLGRPYQPGDIITGRVVRQAPVVSPMAIVEVWLLGRTKVKLGITRSSGQVTWVEYYRGRFNYFDKNPHSIHAGPVHIPPKGGAEIWEFALEIPTTMSPTSVLSQHQDSSKGSFVPLTAHAISTQSLPGSFAASGSEWRKSYEFNCYVEYHVEASITFQGTYGKTVTASQPIQLRAQPMPYPLASYDFLSQSQMGGVQTFRLAPGMEDRHLSIKQKTQKLLHSSKVPSLGFILGVETPAAIQLGHDVPVPFRIRITPDRKHTSDVVHDAPQTALLTSLELILKAKTSILANNYTKNKAYETHDTLKHRMTLPCLLVTTNYDMFDMDKHQVDHQSPPGYEEKDLVSQPQDVKRRLPTPPHEEAAPAYSKADSSSLLGEASTSKASGKRLSQGSVSKTLGIRLPINWASATPIDVGTIMDLHISSAHVSCLGGRCLPTAEGGLHPDFISFGIRHEHLLKWNMTLEIAGESVSFEAEQPLSVLAPSEEQGGIQNATASFAELSA